MPGDLPFIQSGIVLYDRANWSARAHGFKRAADILSEHILARITDGDLVIYPIVFLYRHYVELELKSIIYRGKENLGERKKLKPTHKLFDLWSECSGLLHCKGAVVDTPEAAAFEEGIRQFDQFDAKSDSFRYPVDKNNETTPSAYLKSIDLPNLRLTVNKMAFFLELVDEVLCR